MIHISANILPSLFSNGSLWLTLPDFRCLVVLPKTQQAYVPLTTTHTEILHTLVWKGEIIWRREKFLKALFCSDSPFYTPLPRYLCFQNTNEILNFSLAFYLFGLFYNHEALCGIHEAKKGERPGSCQPHSCFPSVQALSHLLLLQSFPQPPCAYSLKSQL